MPDRQNATYSKNLITALGGTIAAGDAVYVTQDSHPYTEGLDLSAADLLLFQIGPGYGGDIEGLILVANQTGTGQVRIAGAGRRYGLRSTSSSGVIHEILHEPVAGASLELTTLDTERLCVNAGTVIVRDTADVNRIFADGPCHLQIDKSGSFVPAEIHVQSGATVRLSRDAAAVTVAGGTLIADDVTVTPSTLNVHNGSQVYWRGGNVTGGTIGGGAVLDFTQLRQPVTWSNLTFTGRVTIRRLRSGHKPTFSACIFRFNPNYIEV